MDFIDWHSFWAGFSAGLLAGIVLTMLWLIWAVNRRKRDR